MADLQLSDLFAKLKAPTEPPVNDNQDGAPANRSTTGVSASDLVASFQQTNIRPGQSVPQQPGTMSDVTSPSNDRATLLKLLQHNEPGQSSSRMASFTGLPSSTSTPTRVFGEPAPSSPFEPQVTTPKRPFTYVNPFDSLPQSSTDAAALGALGRSPQQSAIKKSSSRSRTASPALVSGPHRSAAQVGKGVKSASSVVERGAQEQGKGVHRPDSQLDQHMKDAVHDAAVDLRDELHDGKTKSEMERHISKPITAALQETATAIAQEGVADSWESADVGEDQAESADQYTVQVYNLPMRPFVSLRVSGSDAPASKIRPDVVMKISSLKKEFNQIDRTLATASPNHIVYVIAKGGGLRIIRQDDASNNTVFRKSQHQIFNVTISSLANSDSEVVLATGHNGSVYWTSVPSRTDISLEDIDKESFIFPPPPSPDENTSNALLKTRAKKSSRHLDFFAMGRGKLIYMVWPAVAQSNAYLDQKSRIVNSVKYLGDDSVKISTGKASKDFTFSEDDTCIVSLDKSGKIKFWDISKQIERTGDLDKQRSAPTEITEPVMTLTASSATERAWPTSIQLVDKERAVIKGTAFRYMLVGLAQNHTIQLWDIGLGKAVQELNLPHANENDAICSIAYHAKSGIVVVGHPTRNSLYLIHLSAPKYHLPYMTQARYIGALANPKVSLPRPESTAIMSGIREISLSSLGSLRSLEVTASNQSEANREHEAETVFEIYMMHSRGVHCLRLERQDLGWGDDGKVIGARDAELEKKVIVSDLVHGSSGQTSGEDKSAKPSDASAKQNPKASPVKRDPTPTSSKAATDAAVAPTPQRLEVNGTSKADKKKRKPGEEASEAHAEVPKSLPHVDSAPRPGEPQETSAHIKEELLDDIAKEIPPAGSTSVSTKGEQLTEQILAALLDERNSTLYRRIDEDKRVQEAASAARQDAVLRLVSSTLTENVEKSLARIVSSTMQDLVVRKVIPEVTNVTATTLDNKLAQSLAPALSNVMARETRTAFPESLNKALQHADVSRKISDAVLARVAPIIGNNLETHLESKILPALHQSTADACIKAIGVTERRIYDRLQNAEAQNERDAAKIDRLTRTVSELSGTLTSMIDIQTQTMQEIVTLRAEVHEQRREAADASTQRSRSGGAQRAEPRSAEEAEYDAIALDMSEGRVEQGTVKWLQSASQNHLFDTLFHRIPPAYLESCNQIVTLSVAAAVTVSMNTHLPVRLTWLETALATTDPHNAETSQFAERLMDVLVERLTGEYMRLNEAGQGATGEGKALLERIHANVRQAKVIKAAAAAAVSV